MAVDKRAFRIDELERMRMLEFWLDAGDGALIGGDIAE